MPAIDFGLLNYNMQNMMRGLQNASWVLDPSQLTGDATTNRAKVYSGDATTPRSPLLAPGSYAPGTPGVASAAAPGAMSGDRPLASAVMSGLQAPASAVAQSAPTQTAAMMASTTGGAQPQASSTDPNAPKDDFRSMLWFDEKAAENAHKPEWQRQWNAANFGSNGSGAAMDGLMLPAGMAPPTSKNGQFFMTGTTPGGQESGEGGMTAARNTYGYMPNAPQIPPELQAMVAQFLGQGQGTP